MAVSSIIRAELILGKGNDRHIDEWSLEIFALSWDCVVQERKPGGLAMKAGADRRVGVQLRASIWKNPDKRKEAPLRASFKEVA